MRSRIFLNGLSFMIMLSIARRRRATVTDIYDEIKAGSGVCISLGAIFSALDKLRKNGNIVLHKTDVNGGKGPRRHGEVLTLLGIW